MENEITEYEFDQQCDDMWNVSVEHRLYLAPWWRPGGPPRPAAAAGSGSGSGSDSGPS